MDDLVLLRELIRNPESNCFPLSINSVFANLRFETLLECLITRASPPCNPIAVALTFNLLGIMSMKACVRTAKSVDKFARWYNKRLNALIHLDVGPVEFNVFKGGMGGTFVLACRTSANLQLPDRSFDPARSTRPASLIQMEVRSRRPGMSACAGRKRKTIPTSVSTRSTKVKRTVSITTGLSSQSSIVIVGSVDPQVRHHTEVWRKYRTY